MGQKQFRILALFDYNSYTGYSTVSKNLVENWKLIHGKNMMLDIVAINYLGPDYVESENVRVCSGKEKDFVKDDYGRHVFLKTLLDNDYELIFIMLDLGVVVPMIPSLIEIKQKKKSENRKQYKSIYYFPVDFHLTPQLTNGLEFFDVLATYTDYGKKQLLARNPKLKFGDIRVIPHGVNTTDFHPINNVESYIFRTHYFGEKNAHKFIIGNINRNQPRKDIPATIFGFMEYKAVNPESFLYLHMNPNDPHGWKLKNILAQTPLIEGEDYMFQVKEDLDKGADVDKMNQIYNSLDVYLTTTTGEGWGLTVTESMACLLPVIAPNHTSLTEICGNGKRAFMLNDLFPDVELIDNVIRFRSDIYEVCEKLIEAQQAHKGWDSTMVSYAYQYVLGLEWGRISKLFADEMKKLA